MPRIIPNLKEKIMTAGKRQLLEKGYGAVTVREVATECGIGLGTLYNYFANKEDMIMQIMLEDWRQILEEGAKKRPETAEGESACRLLYDSVQEFCSMYDGVWHEYIQSGRMSRPLHLKHETLIDEIIEKLQLSRFAVETVLHFAMLPSMTYEDIQPYLKKIFD